MLKQDCRALYKAKRIRLDTAEVDQLNASLLLQLQGFDWTAFANVHVFLSISKFKEPDTTAFIAWMKEYHPTISFVVSKSDFVQGTMTNYRYDENIDLKENAWGIPEPTAGVIVDEKEIDAVIVPMLVCDQYGNRVGFGKGFYDRFLSKCRADIVTIGLSFFEPIDLIEDTDTWDYPLNYCITPSGIYTFIN